MVIMGKHRIRIIQTHLLSLTRSTDLNKVTHQPVWGGKYVHLVQWIERQTWHFTHPLCVFNSHNISLLTMPIKTLLGLFPVSKGL
jgi:hypothetical protein